MNILLVAPYDPHQGNFTFSAPPLGVWRICGFLRHQGIDCTVFDPTLSTDPHEELANILREHQTTVVGFSLTGLTLPYDLSLAHCAKRASPKTLLIGGGIEATFNHAQIFLTSPIDYCVAGEGELPLLEIYTSLKKDGCVDHQLSGLIYRDAGTSRVNPNRQMDYSVFRNVTQQIPYGDMPIRRYWETIHQPSAERADDQEDRASEQEIKSIRIMTSNYCPMKCTFCGYTNFLDRFCVGSASVVRMNAEDIVDLIGVVVKAYPDVKTIIFQDDLFICHNDDRIEKLCELLIQQKEMRILPEDLSFIATTRVDTMQWPYLVSMKRAGFRLLGYGVESFSKRVLGEYGKQEIYPFIDSTLSKTLSCGIKPFLDIILASPESTLDDVMMTLDRCLDYLMRGCEVSIYPTVIPFSGAEMVKDHRVQELIVYVQETISQTNIQLHRGISIQPRSPEVRNFLDTVNATYNHYFSYFKATSGVTRFPSRLRSMIYIISAIEQYPESLPHSVEQLKDYVFGPIGGYRTAENVSLAY